MTLPLLKRRELNPNLPSRCADCLFPDQPVVQGHGTADGLLILGEAPGAQEARTGLPFVGESGELLKRTLLALAEEGVTIPEYYITNTLLCRPIKNTFPGIAGLQCCQQRLLDEVQLVNPRKILTLGVPALSAVLHSPRMVPLYKWRGRGFYTTWTHDAAVYTVATYHPAAVLRDPDLWRDFASDIEKALTHQAPSPDPTLRTVIAQDDLECCRRLEKLVEIAGTGYLSCDLETTGFDPLQNQILSVGFCALSRDRDGFDEPVGESLIVPADLLGSDRVLTALYRVLTNQTFPGTLAFHNLKFDLKFLDALFASYLHPLRVTDTMSMHYTLDERPIGRFKIHGLKDLARVRYDATDYEFDFKAFSEADEQGKRDLLFALYQYQSLDCYYTARLAYDLKKEMEVESPKFSSLVDNLLVPATVAFADIELYGVRINIPYLQDLKAKVEVEIAGKLASLKDLGKQNGVADFNPGSHKQVSELVYQTWKSPHAKVTGDVSGSRAKSATTTNRTVLHALSVQAQDPNVREGLQAIVDYRARVKILKTYIDGILDRVGPDGRIRSDFRIIGTATGRLSSSDPNLQNLPQLLGKEIRYAFVPTEGYTWVEADYSQLELRVAAVFCDDQAMIETFRAGRDIHREVAAVMFTKPAEEVDDFDRDLAKRADFGILYGRTAKALVEGSEFEFLPPGKHWWTLKEAEYFLQRFLDGFPALRDYMKATKQKAADEKKIEAPTGRIRRFPFIPAKNKNAVMRQAFNAPIQGTASDICLQALIDLHDQLPDGAHVLFSVHDAIYLEVETPLVNQVVPQMSRIMAEAGQKILPGSPVPFESKIKVGDRWGMAKSWAPEKERERGEVTASGMYFPRERRTRK